MGSFLDRVFGPKVEVDLVRAELESRLSFENSRLDKELLKAYVQKNRTADITVFLSAILTLSEDGTIHVTQEMELLQDYIDLIKEIKGEKFYMNVDVKSSETAWEIAPLILFPLVQNAVKYGYSSLEKYPIKVKVTISKSGVVLEVSNRINHYVENQGDSELIRFYKQRLQLLYPDKHDLLLNSNSNTFKATLFLRC